MNNNEISQKQGISMVVMFIIGTSSLLVMGLEAKMDIWIAILLAMGVSAVIILIFSRLMCMLPNKDFFEITEFFLGKTGSKIPILLFTWFSFQLCALVLRNFGTFIITVGLPETPMFVAMGLLMLLSIITVRSGLSVFGQWTQVIVFFVLGFVLISVLLASSNMNSTNILPVMDKGLVPIAKGSLGVISFPFAETVVFLLVFPALRKGVSAKKMWLKGLLIGGSVILVTSLADILVLGASAEDSYFPTYTMLSTVHYGEFLQRLEVIAGIVFVLGVFSKLSILLFATCRSAGRLLGFKDYRFLVIPIAFLILNYAEFSFDSMIYHYEWAVKVWPYYGPIFEILLPVVLLIIFEIKRRKKGGLSVKA